MAIHGQISGYIEDLKDADYHGPASDPDVSRGAYELRIRDRDLQNVYRILLPAKLAKSWARYLRVDAEIMARCQILGSDRSTYFIATEFRVMPKGMGVMPDGLDYHQWKQDLPESA